MRPFLEGDLYPMLFLLVLACSTADAVLDHVTEPGNIIHQYEWFHDTYQTITARSAQIDMTQSALDEEIDAEEKVRLRTELMGQQQSCRQMIADYNSGASKMTTLVYKGTTLPSSLDYSLCQ